MTVRWITERLGTSPWQERLACEPLGIVDVRLLRDASGNPPYLIRAKISEALNHLDLGKSVVICCDYGISRSNAIAAAVLAAKAGISLDDGLQQVIRATRETGIKIDFVEDLRQALNTAPHIVSGSRVLVLGLDGFIGRVVGPIIDPVASPMDGKREQDLLGNPVMLDAALSKVGADRILFCWHPPGLDTNRAAGQLITALRNVLEVCRVRRAGLIFLSGQQVFAGHGGSGQIPVSEVDDPQPAGAAGDGLFLGETLVRQYAMRHGLATLVVRSSNIYGPGDERPGMLNSLLRKALTQQEVVTHRYRNGTPCIDLVHIRDLAHALELAIRKQLTGVLHISSGNPIATDELARMVVHRTGSTSGISSIDMPDDYHMVRLESTRAVTDLGWRPGIDLEAGISDMIVYTRNSTL